MLLLLTTLIFGLSVILLCVKRNRRSLLLVALTSSLLLFWFGILTYIAKRGGIGRELIPILYGTEGIRQWLQYMALTLGQLGYTVALGRTLFPLFLVLTSLDFCYFEHAAAIKRKWWAFLIIPAATLIIYIPPVFETLMVPNEFILRAWVMFGRLWIFTYVLGSLGMLTYEAFSISMPYFRRRFLTRAMLLASLSVLYLIYCPQDPAQIYMFYRNDYMWMLGLWYLSKGFNVVFYAIICVCSMLFAMVGFVAIMKYTQLNWDEQHQEAEIRRAGKAVQSGVNIFIHGIKNELLANRAVIKRIGKTLGQDQLDIKAAQELTQRLSQNNEAILERISTLYQTSKHNNVHLMPTHASDIIDASLQRLHRKYPESLVETRMDSDEVVLCDKNHLCEALANILANGWEAQIANQTIAPLKLTLEIERLWTVFRIEDAGGGIAPAMQHKLFEPFSSDKNSATNWGMGMYYTRDVVKSHLGSIRFDSGSWGTIFYVLLPRYGGNGYVAKPSIDS